jgi:hypothetical protein
MSLFAIVVTITMGAILTIVDLDRKARSLALTIDNMNFALETFTRDVKTADPSIFLNVTENSITFKNENEEIVTYAFELFDSNITLTRQVLGSAIPVISPDVSLDSNSRFEFKGSPQPFVRIILDGQVNFSDKTATDFNIQTSVSVRELK